MALKWFDDVATLLAKASAQPQMTVAEVYTGPFPLVDVDIATGDRSRVEMVSAKIYKVHNGSDEYASVVLCREVAGKPQWSIYCGDNQVQGKFSTDGKTLAKKLRDEGKVANKVTNLLESSPWVKTVPDMASCNFFKMQDRGTICSHTQAVLGTLTAPDLEGMATELVGWKSGASVAVSAGPKFMHPEEEALNDVAFVQPAMLAGERGSGKTFLARQMADIYDAVYLEMQMHPSMEAWEFRAHDRAWNGKVYTVLGKLAEAVHWVQKGKKVVLCMDEFLNMNPVYATVINTALSLTERDTYIIETGRIIDQGDGIGTLETVEVPADMFWVVATSNVGPRYNTDITPSVRARFQIIMMNTNPDRTKSILDQVLAKYDMPIEVSEMFESFIRKVQLAVDANTLQEEATTRLACNVIRAVYMRAKRDKRHMAGLKQWLPEIKKQVLREATQVVNFTDNRVMADQMEIYKNLVNDCFRVKK